MRVIESQAVEPRCRQGPMPEGQGQEGGTPVPLQQCPLPAGQSPIETEGPWQTAGQVLEGAAGRGFPAWPGGSKETVLGTRLGPAPGSSGDSLSQAEGQAGWEVGTSRVRGPGAGGQGPDTHPAGGGSRILTGTWEGTKFEAAALRGHRCLRGYPGCYGNSPSPGPQWGLGQPSPCLTFLI